MGLHIPVISSIALGLLGGLGTALGSNLIGSKQQAPEIPTFDQNIQLDDETSLFDEQAEEERLRSQIFRRQAASRSMSLTNLQDNPIEEESLLRIVAGSGD